MNQNPPIELKENRQFTNPFKLRGAMNCRNEGHYKDILLTGYCLTCRHKFSLGEREAIKRQNHD